MRRLAVELSPEPFPGKSRIRLAAGDCLHPLRPQLDVLDAARIDACVGEDGVDDRLPADGQHGDLLAGKVRRRGDLAVARQDEVEHLRGVLLPDTDHGDTRVDRRREHARGGVAHVDLVRRDELHLARPGACVEPGVDVEFLVVPHLYGDADVVVVHHVERAARRNPADAVELVRTGERVLDRDRPQQPETGAGRGRAPDELSPRQALAHGLLQRELRVFHRPPPPSVVPTPPSSPSVCLRSRTRCR